MDEDLREYERKLRQAGRDVVVLDRELHRRMVAEIVAARQRSVPPGANILPNGLVQGSPEDRALWRICTRCNFHGPLVGAAADGAHACLGSCGGVTPNPDTCFTKADETRITYPRAAMTLRESEERMFRDQTLREHGLGHHASRSDS